MPQNFKKNRNYIFIFLGALLALFLVLFLFKNFPPLFMTRAGLFIIQPVIYVENKIVSVLEKYTVVFKNKAGLQAENAELKQQIIDLKIKGDFYDAVFKENEELKMALSIAREKKIIFSSILLRPGYGIYNSLFLDAGSKDGVEMGIRVTAFGNVLLGYVSDVMADSSRVKLISFPGQETNVFINGQVSAIAVGVGGENLEIALPHDINIEVGDSITTLGTSPLFLGIVEEVVREPAAPFQKIIFRLPVNIQELQQVFLLK